MKKTKIISAGLCLALVLSMTACASKVTEADYAAWAEANGYHKDVDVVSSATKAKQGGVNFGAIEWDTDLQKAAIREFLKGGTYLGSPDLAQDETGYNYREMYQLATCVNNIPTNTNLEMVLDASTLHLLGVSEAGTGKTNEMKLNPKVSISWCRQIRPSEEDTYNYYCSYGVQYNGTVHVFDEAYLDTEAGKAAAINVFDKYYPTLASTYMAYARTVGGLTDKAEIEAAKVEYIRNSLKTMVIYEIVPDNIVVTAPFIINLIPQMTNATKFTTVQAGADKYAYDLCLSDAFIDRLIAYKNQVLATEEGKQAVEDYYAGPMFQMLDPVCAQYNMPTSKDAALAPNSAAGLKTQTTWIPE